MLDVESILLREGLRALQDGERSIKMAAMGERMRKNRHRVQEQRARRPEIADPRRIAHVLRKIRRQKLNRAVVVSTNPAGVPQSETRAIGKSLVLEAIGHFKSAAADLNRLPRIAAELAEHMTLLHRDFGHGDRIAACVGGRGGLREMLEIQLVLAGGEIRRGDGSIDVDKRSILFAHVPQGVLVCADRLPVGGVPLRELPGFLPVFRGPRLVAGARQMRRERLRRRFGDRRLQAHEGFGDMGVNLATLAAQHAFVRRFLNQRMLEAVGRIGRKAVNEHEVGVDKLLQRGVEFSLGAPGDREQQPEREFPPRDRPNLRDVARVAEPVEPRGERLL